MSQDFETLNKRIATFIIVSSAIAIPAYADGGFAGGGITIPSAQEDIISRYAGPGMGMGIQIPSTPGEVPIDRYAGPGMIVPGVQEPPMVVKYAGPGIEPDSPLDQARDLSNPDSLSVVNSADSVTADSSEDDHVYGQVKVAPGHFKFW